MAGQRDIRWFAVLFFALLALNSPPAARAADQFDQGDVPLEVEPTDPKLAKIVLISGKPSHGTGEHEMFAGMALFAKILKENPGVAPVMVRDEWPKNVKILDGAKSIVMFVDGVIDHEKYPRERLDVLKKLTDSGTGIVALHYALHHPTEEGERSMQWVGGYYDFKTSSKGHWTAKFEPSDHPVCRGVKPTSLEDGWHFNIRFVDNMQGITPILKSAPPDKIRSTEDAKKYPGREEVISWAYERPDGQRAFVFTGGHLHKDWADENRRRLLTNGILWTAKLEVPKEGAKVDIEPDDLKVHFDKKAAAKPAAK